MNTENRKDELLQKYTNLGNTIEDLEADRKQVLQELLDEITPYEPGQILRSHRGEFMVFVRVIAQNEGKMSSFAGYRIKKDGTLYKNLTQEYVYSYAPWEPVEGEVYDLSSKEGNN